MKQHNSIIKKAWKQFCRIKLIDQFLIVIMLILLTQSLVGLFTSYGDANITDRIDVVMRTIMTSIFGYFVSSKFIKNESENGDTQSCEKKDKETSFCDKCICKKETDCEQVMLKETAKGSNRSNSTIQYNLQIKVVGSICIFSIVSLFVIRYFAYDNNDSLAFIFLFRDFLCSGIGFLIGMPSEESKSKWSK